MAELRDFDPESMTDAVDALIHYAEETATEALGSERMLGVGDWERSQIALALIGIRPAVNALIRFIPHLNPEAENGFLVVLCTLMGDLMAIGSASTYTKDAQAHLEEVQVKIMRMRNSGNAQTRKEEITAAIMEVCKGTALIGSDKFAKSIQPEVCKKLGVGPKARGYSATTIKRIIRAILQECRES